MLTCRAAEALIVRDADGGLGAWERSELEAHAATCERCREAWAAGAPVRRALAARPAGGAAPGFASRVDARLAWRRSGDWLAIGDFRRWTEWLLPVAAVLTLVAGYAGFGSGRQAGATVTTRTAIEAWTLGSDGSATTVQSALKKDVSTEDLLATMIGARAETSAEVERNGR